MLNPKSLGTKKFKGFKTHNSWKNLFQNNSEGQSGKMISYWSNFLTPLNLVPFSSECLQELSER